MILPKVDADKFLDLVARAPLIAFQAVRFGYAVAAPDVAYYAPIYHPGGGNLNPETFIDRLGYSFINRISTPALRTLRPTAKPIVTDALMNYLGKLAPGEILTFELAFTKASGDDPAIVEFQTQVVIQAIEEHGRPDLQATMSGLKREALLEACERVREQADMAAEALEEGKNTKMTLHLMQCSAALKFALEMLLKP